MVKEYITKVWANRGGLVVRIPKKMVRDPEFPLKRDDDVRLRVENGKLVVERLG